MKKENKLIKSFYRGINISSYIFSYIIAGFLAGYFFDYLTGLEPLFLIICSILGLVLACYYVNKEFKKFEEDDKKQNKL